MATADGFRPTELNPRFGAGLGVITSGLDGLPLHLVLDLVVSGRELDISATELEALLLAAADANRSGGTWQLHVDTPVEVSGRAARYEDGTWRWAGPDERRDGVVVAKDGYARISFEAANTPVGPSVGHAVRGVLALRRRRTGHRDRSVDGAGRRDAVSRSVLNNRLTTQRSEGQNGSDAATGRRPVLVAQQPLVQLAGRVAGELAAEVDRARALHVGELRSAVAHQLGRQRIGLLVVDR